MATTARRCRDGAPTSMTRAVVALLVATLGAAIGTRAAHAQAPTATDVRIGAPGDRWLDLEPFHKIERATRRTADGDVFGYAITYRFDDSGDLTFFWPRALIDFSERSSRSRSLFIRLPNGRLSYPRRLTAASLPAVHRGIVRLETHYAADAQGGIQAARAFLLVTSLALSTPTLKVRPVSGSGPTITRIPGTSTRKPNGPTISSKPTASKPTASKPTASKPTASKPTASKPTASKPTASKPASRPTRTSSSGTTTTAAKPNVASSRALARALEQAGHVRPPGTAAHHIVAGNAPRAKESRALLEEFGIGINDAANGVFLPRSTNTVNAAGSTVHSTLHTKSYFEKVHTLLEPAATRAEVESVLKQIKQMLIERTF